jgi:hypothetical protein
MDARAGDHYMISKTGMTPGEVTSESSVTSWIQARHSGHGVVLGNGELIQRARVWLRSSFTSRPATVHRRR